MRTVHEVSRLAGVSVRTLQYYDRIGLLRPAEYSEAGYRLYDDLALERLQQILLFRELEFPLKEIKKMMESPDFDREKALDQQIELLRLKKEHLEDLMELARQMKRNEGGKKMDFSAFDRTKQEAYARQAKDLWGGTAEYREYERKQEGRSGQETDELNRQMMGIFAEIGSRRNEAPDSEKVQELIRQLQLFITEHFYNCSDRILMSLGQMYASGGEMTENIDRAGGEGTGVFTYEAIQIHCARKK